MQRSKNQNTSIDRNVYASHNTIFRQVTQFSQRNRIVGIVSFSRNTNGMCPWTVPVINALINK